MAHQVKAPYDRTSMRRTHLRITELAQRGKYREAELELQCASTEYQAIMALLRYTVKLRYMVTERHPVAA